MCFPHAGGSASFYVPVSAALAPSIDVVAVQYPGRQERYRERPFESLHELADAAASELVALADRPLALFGHSLGAAVAFEVARRLERDSGTGVVALFASGRRAPGALRVEDVHRRDDAGLIAEVRSLEGTDSRVLDDADVLRLVLPALRADYTAIETYRPEPDSVIRAPVVVLVGDRDPQVTIDEAVAWRNHTTGGVDLRIFGGGHFYLLEHRAEVLDAVASVVAGQPTAHGGR